MYTSWLVLLISTVNAATLPYLVSVVSNEVRSLNAVDYIRDLDATHFVKLDAIHLGRNLKSSDLLDAQRDPTLERDSTSYSADIDLIGSEAWIAYVTEVTLGSNSTFKMVIDTGSSDTWVVRKKFDCFELDMTPRPNDYCKLGPGYQPSPTFKSMDDFHFNTRYGDGERLSGSVGTEHVKVGTLAVLNQRINLVDRAAWHGDGQTSGLLGLGFPAITSNFRATNQSDISRPVQYDPFFTTALKAGLVPSGSFSIALQRDLNSIARGYLSFNGLPPVKTYGRSVSVAFSPRVLSPVGQTDYVIPIDGFVFPTSTNLKTSVTIDALVDSGTPLLLVPESVALAYNALWNPNSQDAPPFSILINGTEFQLDTRDLKYTTKTGFGSAVFAGKRTILGGTFMRNVVSTFDVAGSRMRFASTNPKSGPEQQAQ